MKVMYLHDIDLCCLTHFTYNSGPSRTMHIRDCAYRKIRMQSPDAKVGDLIFVILTDYDIKMIDNCCPHKIH